MQPANKSYSRSQRSEVPLQDDTAAKRAPGGIVNPRLHAGFLVNVLNMEQLAGLLDWRYCADWGPNLLLVPV
jgi:hypothetical protein